MLKGTTKLRKKAAFPAPSGPDQVVFESAASNNAVLARVEQGEEKSRE
jgi:hypothetical protein